MIVITSGDVYTDLDVLACAIAYGEILNQTNRQATVYLPGPLNEGIVSSMRKWDFKYETSQEPGTHSYVIVDVSDPDHINRVVDPSQIFEIYDHHFGHEQFWRQKLGDNSHIEPVGACATLIWEQAQKQKVTLSQVAINLLYTAIFSNTLNFKASVTSNRDKLAFTELSKLTSLPTNWIETYYTELSTDVFANPSEAIIKDIKTTQFSGYSEPFIIGQLELWDGKDFIFKHKTIIKDALTQAGSPYWFMTVPSISEGKNYLYSENSEVQSILIRTIGAKFTGDTGETSKLWLRKEILRELQKVSV